MFKVMRRALKLKDRVFKPGEIITEKDLKEIPEKHRERRIEILKGLGRLAILNSSPNLSPNLNSETQVQIKQEKQRCKAIRQDGEQCTRTALSGSDYCSLPAHRGG